MAENEKPPEQQPPAAAAKVEKPAKPPKAPKKPKANEGLYLPVLAEFVISFAIIFLVVVFLAMSTASWWSGATLLDFVLRTGAALLVLGSLLVLVSRQVTKGVLNASQAEMEEARQKAAIEAEAAAQFSARATPQAEFGPKVAEPISDPDVINLQGLPERH